jgi:lysophospholipase L1-like esterase
MRAILCYGDSNTWGYDPQCRDRFTRNVRWTGVLAQELGRGYYVIEEGLSGRTTVWDDPVEGNYKNGRTYLTPCLESHQPLDLVVLMLGTNDLKVRFHAPASDIAKSAGVLVDLIQRSQTGPQGNPPQVLLVAPPPIAQPVEWAEMFGDGEQKSRKFGDYYREVAAEYDCYFLDAGQVIVSSEIDGIHFEASQHARLGQALAGCIQEIFEDRREL